MALISNYICTQEEIANNTLKGNKTFFGLFHIKITLNFQMFDTLTNDWLKNK